MASRRLLGWPLRRPLLGTRPRRRYVRHHHGALLWLRCDEASRTLSLFNPATGKFGPAFAPGSSNVLTSGAATLYLADSSVLTLGPTSPEVTLVLSLGFAPPAAGQDYPVEVRAANDDGQVEGFVRAATLSVTSKRR